MTQCRKREEMKIAKNLKSTNTCLARILFVLLGLMTYIPAYADGATSDHNDTVADNSGKDGEDDNNEDITTPTSEQVQLVRWKHASMDNYATVNGYFDQNISGGTYNVITGVSMRNIVNGNINMELDDVQQFTVVDGVSDETGIYGSWFMATDIDSIPYVAITDSAHRLNQQKILGTTTLTITDSTIQSKVIGHNFFQRNTIELIDSGAIGKTTITLNNTSVGRSLRGVNFGSQPVSNGVSFGDIELNINDSFVKEEVVAAGSNASAGNVVINVNGNSVIGYTDATATTPYLTEGGWIIAGGNRSGANIASTVVNLNPNGSDNAIYIGGDVFAGARYRGENADTGSVLGDATLNMFGDGNINIGGDVRAHNVDGISTLNISNTTANITGSVIGFDNITIGVNGNLRADKLVMTDSDTLNIVLQDQDNYGTLNLNTLDANNATLNVILGSAGEYDFLSATHVASNFNWNLTNPLFELSQHNGVITATQKSSEQIASEIGATTDVANAMSAFAGSNNDNIKQMNVLVQNAIAQGNTEYVKRELSKLNPSAAPIATSVALGVQNHVMAAAGERMSLALTGRNGGDVHADFGVWAKGMYNKTKYKDVFSGNTWGASVGFDTDLNHSVILGVGYSYGQTDVDLHTHDVDIDSNTIFVYGQYRNSDWFINGTIAYTMAKYDWNKNIFGVNYNPSYHVNSLAEQVMSCYHFANGITPTLGLRYLDVKQDSYFDGLTTVSAVNSTYLTGIAGVDYKYVWIAPNTALFWNPELHAAVTYDMVSDADVAVVMIPGAAAYTIGTENLSRVGGEFGVGLSAEYYYLTVSLNYDLNLHRDFTSHTGSLKIKYKF